MHTVWMNLLIILPPVASVKSLSVERGSELFSQSCEAPPGCREGLSIVNTAVTCMHLSHAQTCWLYMLVTCEFERGVYYNRKARLTCGEPAKLSQSERKAWRASLPYLISAGEGSTAPPEAPASHC